MSDPLDPLKHAVKTERGRRDRHRREGERSMARNLALAGTVGWLITLPAIAGALLGRWLDRRFSSGITLTAALIFAGVVWGGFLAWQHIHQT